MMNGRIRCGRIGLMVTLLFVAIAIKAHPINDYYKKHKNDRDMEARIVPPKAASFLVDEDYPEAIDVLKSLTTLKYLNYFGDEKKVKDYAKRAILAKGEYELLLKEEDDKRAISVFGIKKNGVVRKIIAVVQSKTQFVLLIGKGKLNKRQIQVLPLLAKEI